jgi:ubiquinone/menaquinone biosynthesis C-methylase UbiE
MKKIERAKEILEQGGISSLISSSSNYFLINLTQKLSPVFTPLVKLLIVSEGRSWEDANWLVENKKDRHDALVGPSGFISHQYVDDRSKARHFYRYVFAANIINKVRPEKNLRILDVASGTGYGSNIIEKKTSKNTNCFSTEIDTQAIHYGSKYYGGSEYIQGDVQNLPYSINTFDVILSYETIEHVPNVEEAIGEFRRILKNDGDIFISVPYNENINPNNQHGKDYPHKHSFNEKTLSKIFNKKFDSISVDYYQQNVPDELKPISSISELPPGISKYQNKNSNSIKSLLAHISTITR